MHLMAVPCIRKHRRAVSHTPLSLVGCLQATVFVGDLSYADDFVSAPPAKQATLPFTAHLIPI